MNLLQSPADACALLQDYLDHAIPLVPQMQVHVRELTPQYLVLAAPLTPNRNHIGTVFGGSLNGLATLACWGLVWLALHGRDAHIVIQEGHMKFMKPATDDFTARCAIPTGDTLAKFIAQFDRRGKARLILSAEIECKGMAVASFEGSFAAGVARKVPE